MLIKNYCICDELWGWQEGRFGLENIIQMESIKSIKQANWSKLVANLSNYLMNNKTNGCHDWFLLDRNYVDPYLGLQNFVNKHSLRVWALINRKPVGQFVDWPAPQWHTFLFEPASKLGKFSAYSGLPLGEFKIRLSIPFSPRKCYETHPRTLTLENTYVGTTDSLFLSLKMLTRDALGFATSKSFQFQGLYQGASSSSPGIKQDSYGVLGVRVREALITTGKAHPGQPAPWD